MQQIFEIFAYSELRKYNYDFLIIKLWKNKQFSSFFKFSKKLSFNDIHICICL